MYPNYIVLSDNADFGITQFSIFRPTSDPQLYECATNPDIQIGLVTILAFPDYFSPVLILDCVSKMTALADRIINGDNWTPAEGDYFTDIDNSLALYLITAVVAPFIQYVRISGGEIEDEEVAQTGFTDTRVKIETDQSGSGSGSGS